MGNTDNNPKLSNAKVDTHSQGKVSISAKTDCSEVLQYLEYGNKPQRTCTAFN